MFAVGVEMRSETSEMLLSMLLSSVLYAFCIIFLIVVDVVENRSAMAE